MSGERFQSFEAFWPFYLGEHSLPTTRWFHFVGSCLALLTVVSAVVMLKPFYAFGALFWGYGFAWVSHFFIEKNRPATFTYPRWSLMADFVMWGKIVRGEMDAEVERVMAERAKKEASEAPAQETRPTPGPLVN